MTRENKKKMLKIRRAKKGWVTRTAQELDKIVASADPSIIELSDTLKLFDKRLEELDEVQKVLEVDLDDSEFETDLDAANTFRKEACKSKYAAEILLDTLLGDQTQTKEGGSSCQHSTSCSPSTSPCEAPARLPKIELPKFKGGAMEWVSFWSQFNAHVHCTTMAPVSKFTYLLSLLEGDAKRAVKGFELSDDMYESAVEVLKTRFGREEQIIFAHIQALLNVEPPPKAIGTKYVDLLWKIRDQILWHVRSLKALGVSGDKCEVILTPVILSRLPNEVRLEWSREGEGREGDLQFLLDFLLREITRIERSEALKDVSSTSRDTSRMVAEENRSSHIKKEHKKSFNTPTASALYASSATGGEVCGFCYKKHQSEKCFTVLKLNVPERKEKVRASNLCFRCLKPGHLAKGCYSKCSKCAGRHSVLICESAEQTHKVPQKESASPAEESVMFSCEPLYKGKCTVLNTATVEVVGTNGSVYKAKVMFDNGADRSYISTKLAKKCRPKVVSTVSLPYSSFGGHSSGPVSERKLFKLSMLGITGGFKDVLVAEIPKICQPLVRPAVPPELLQGFVDLCLADKYDDVREVEIDILIGLDYYWSLIESSGSIRVGNIVAFKSLFGWILSGAWSTASTGTVSRSVAPQLMSISDISDQQLCKFWDLESVGVKPVERNSNEESYAILDKFNDEVKFVDGRYEVSLQWKDEKFRESLSSNEHVARKRLGVLYQKLEQDEQLFNDYHAIFEQYLKDDLIEVVPNEELDCDKPVYYMPHRPVIREDSTSTKIRPVFDCSSKARNALSLNDCLHTGPSLNPDIVEVLLRFRRWPVAISGDITKAFLQIRLRPEDQDVHRFLLKGESGLKHMRFKRVTFGNTASPFLLNATLKYHFSKYAARNVISELKENMYVDNLISGADTVEEAGALFRDACEVLSEAGMSLTKLVSNSIVIASQVDDIYYIDDEQHNSVLGLKWCSAMDQFTFYSIENKVDFDAIYTKRAVLSTIAKIFDPLGLISPYVMYGKLIFQEIWQLGIDWDEVLPVDISKKFKKWIIGLESLSKFRVPRCFFPNEAWHSLQGIEVHGFGDASCKGYGACVYLRAKVKGKYQVTLVASRSRVAPIKKVTLPRLELLGALLTARLVHFVCKALHLNDLCSLICWTDSTVALSWIRDDPHKRKAFVANRVIEIQLLTPPSCWAHVDGENNPADLISRGALGEELIRNDSWLYGPSFLYSTMDYKEMAMYESQEELKESNVVTCTVSAEAPLFDVKRWGSLSKAIRVVGWVLRFCCNCKNKDLKQEYKCTVVYQ